MNKKDLENKKLFKSIKGIMVIQGKHLKHHHDAPKNIDIRLDTKPYNWKVDSGTYHIQQAKVGRIATVANRNGKSSILITKMIHATGSTAINMAKKLKYVINFQNRKLENHQIVKDKTQPKHRHLTPTQQKRAKSQHKAKLLAKKMPKTEVAKKIGVSVTTIYNWLKKME